MAAAAADSAVAAADSPLGVELRACIASPRTLSPGASVSSTLATRWPGVQKFLYPVQRLCLAEYQKSRALLDDGSELPPLSDAIRCSCLH